MRLWWAFRHPSPADMARARGAAGWGVLRAFTLGMLPWEKPSRSPKFWVAYVRGILFHLGAFAGLAALALSPWSEDIPPTVGTVLFAGVAMGLVAGLAGLIMRWSDGEVRSLSIPDDYVSLALVLVFLAGALIFLGAPSQRTAFYLLSCPMLLYIPFSKVRHCAFFFVSRFYYGASWGRLGFGEHRTRE
ncbi:MAG: hypothetical protein ACUVXH_02970 [Anaerolineae bacterium]